MKALVERTRHVRDWMLFLERYPLVVGPVSTEPPFEIGFDTTRGPQPVFTSSISRPSVARRASSVAPPGSTRSVVTPARR
jgi:hypothetical protein